MSYVYIFLPSFADLWEFAIHCPQCEQDNIAGATCYDTPTPEDIRMLTHA